MKDCGRTGHRLSSFLRGSTSESSNGTSVKGDSLVVETTEVSVYVRLIFDNTITLISPSILFCRFTK